MSTFAWCWRREKAWLGVIDMVAVYSSTMISFMAMCRLSSLPSLRRDMEFGQI